MDDQNEDKGPFQFVILVLSVFVLLMLFIEVAFDLDPEVKSILRTSDNAICFTFLGDFFYRLFRADRKLAFLKWGWIDFISSIPALDAFRIGRAVRVIRVLRILRGVRASSYLISYVFRNRVKGTFASASLISIIMIVFSSIAILQVETLPGSSIQTAEEALWWAFVTITTVGYGDFYPISMEGRIIAVVLMTTGVGLFGTFTGFVASWFVEQDIEEETQETERLVLEELARLREAVEEGIYFDLSEDGPTGKEGAEVAFSFEGLVESVREMSEVIKGRRPAHRKHRYVGRIFVEEENKGEVTWSLADASLSVPNKADPAAFTKAVREGLRQSQTGFADLIGVSVRTIQNWEQGVRKPDAPAMSLLSVAAIAPGVLLHSHLRQVTA